MLFFCLFIYASFTFLELFYQALRVNGEKNTFTFPAHSEEQLTTQTDNISDFTT